MTYELAKELKDARFPQEDRHWYWSPRTDIPTLWCVNALQPESQERLESFIAAPTLSELIEACGERFWSLRRDPKGYFCALGDMGELPGCTTPEEAVARLWLALNKPATTA